MEERFSTPFHRNSVNVLSPVKGIELSKVNGGIERPSKSRISAQSVPFGTSASQKVPGRKIGEGGW